MTHANRPPLSTLDAIFTRRSVRDFAPDRLDAATVLQLLDAAVQAPTALHREPWVFAVIQEPQALRAVSAYVKARWHQRRTTTGWGDAAGANPAASRPAPADFAAHMADPSADLFYGASTVIAIGTRRVDEFAIADCWLAAGTLMLAGCALGLGSCCIGSATGGFNDPGLRRELDFAWDFAIVAPLAVGVPAREAPPVARRPAEIAHWR